MVSRLKRLIADAVGHHGTPFMVFTVQHAEPQNGDPNGGLSQRGREQAGAFASSMKRGDIDVFISGPARANVETVEAMHAAIGGEHVVLNELNGSSGDVSEDDRRQKSDRLSHSRGGFDQASADQFLAVLDLIRVQYAPTQRVMVVTDGERTLNAVRTLRSDDEIEAEAPGTFEQGIPSCAMTTFVWNNGAWETETIAALTIPDI